MSAPRPAAAAREPRRAGWLASRWDRLNGSQRVAGVDLARSLAVLGMFAAHLLVIPDGIDWTDAATWPAVASGRSSILFATLAGVSIGLVTGGREPLVGPAMMTARLRLAVRALLLWLLGVALVATGVPVYVILPAYALLFLIAVPLVGLRTRALLTTTAVLAVVMPVVQVGLDALPLWTTPLGHDLSLALGWHYPFTTWIVFLLAGLGVARAGVRRPTVQWTMLGVGLSLAAVGYGLDGLVPAGGVSGATASGDVWTALTAAVWTADPHSSGLLEVIGSGGFALAVLGACLLICRPWSRDAAMSPVAWAALPLRSVGAMPLTAYTAQLVIWWIVASVALPYVGDLSGFRALEPFWPLTVGTVVACTGWALLVGRGPLEWVLDRVARLVAPTRPAPVDTTERG